MVVLNNALPVSSHFHHFERKNDTCRLFCRRKEKSVEKKREFLLLTGLLLWLLNVACYVCMYGNMVS